MQVGHTIDRTGSYTDRPKSGCGTLAVKSCGGGSSGSPFSWGSPKCYDTGPNTVVWEISVLQNFSTLRNVRKLNALNFLPQRIIKE